jgi:hypothetical protein
VTGAGGDWCDLTDAKARLLPLDRSAGARRVSECVSSTATPPKASSGRTAASDIETEGIMTTKPRIAIVIGSTRPGRYADKAAGTRVVLAVPCVSRAQRFIELPRHATASSTGR